MFITCLIGLITWSAGCVHSYSIVIIGVYGVYYVYTCHISLQAYIYIEVSYSLNAYTRTGYNLHISESNF